jgi:hypothetical protein
MTASPTWTPAITVTVQFFSARSAGSREPFAVIRQRTRSDDPYPDLGQQMTWRLCWEHTTMPVEEAHGGADADIAEISRAEAGQITAGPAPATGRPTRPGCPGWPAPIRGHTSGHTSVHEPVHGLSP